ncbi:MAG: DEAD/DEAH box helicase [Candidatus Binatia bacterium]
MVQGPRLLASSCYVGHMEITITSNLTLGQVPEGLKKQFIEENTFDNPEYRMRKALGKWLKGTPEKLKLWSFDKDTQTMQLPRGYLPAVIAISRREDVVFHIYDQTVETWANFNLEVNGALEGYQEEALEKLLHYPTGTLVGPPGCGKTNILLSAIPELKTTALIIVHTKELFEQTVQRCKDWLGVTPGVIGSGKWKPDDITVAMIQTLARRDLSEITDFFGAILTDEGHHVAAKTWSSVLEQFPARYKYAFTATPQRKDGYTFLIWRYSGGKTAEIDPQDVVDAGRTVLPTFLFRSTNYQYRLDDKGDWPIMLNDLAFDENRNTEILAEIRESVPHCESALVLTDRVAHAELLARRLSRWDFDPVLLHGKLRAEDRRIAMGKVRAGTKLTIATIGIVGEGVDVPGWDLLYLVTPIAGGARTVQAIGRVARAKEGKSTASVIDFVDIYVDGYRENKEGKKEYYYPLREAATKRRRLYKIKKTQGMLF